MGTTPEISVVMAAFNAEDYVKSAVDSILAQTFTHFELIAIDDGSTDKTLEILNSFTDSRVRVVENVTNLGIPKTRNIGIAEAAAPLIAWQDADDISLPTRLEKQVEYMAQNPEIALLGTGRKTMSADGIIKTNSPPMEIPTFVEMLKSNCIIGASVMVRKNRLDAVGGYDDFFRQAEDYDCWLRLMKKYPAANLQEGLYVVRRNKDSLTRANQEELMLYRLLARNRAMDAVGGAMLAQIKSKGIESYYDHLSKKDKIFYHQRVAKRCMNYARNAEALKHYRQLMNLQGASFKVVGNMLRLSLRWRTTERIITQQLNPQQEKLADDEFPVYVISLARAKDRRENVTDRLNKAGVNYEIIDAVDGQTLNLSEYENRLRQDLCYKYYQERLSNGRIGNYLSHYNLWQRMCDDQTPLALVLEDDAIWKDDFFQVVNAAAKRHGNGMLLTSPTTK